MAESLKGIKRTNYCTEISEADLGKELVLTGWTQKQRDLGGLVFITLRDRTGLIQLVVDEDSPEDVREKASKVRSEFVLAAKGVLRKRQDPNPNMPTGDYELLVQELRILSESETPPFYIEEESDVKESLRLEHRYLDLRRPDMAKIMKLKSDLAHFTRNYFYEAGFLDVETPILGKSTPEGARDYLVPSRVYNGQFFALPQSPQLYKQLLMVSGVDKYFQIARCFRDEDLRADRQPEFTQVDIEMSFVEEEDIQNLMEPYLREVLKKFKGKEIPAIEKLTYKEAMDRFGSDKPDMRFGLEICDISDLVADSEFRVFKDALDAGGSVRLITVPEGGKMSRREIDALSEYVKTYRAGGLAWLAPEDEKWRGSILKFVTEDLEAKLLERTAAKTGDLLLIVADKSNKIVLESLGHLRNKVAADLELYDPADDKLVWITEFPLFEWDEEEGRYTAVHHPFTSPMDEDIQYLETDPGRVRSKAYDIVMNGYELGGGSIRIHDNELQNKMFELLGFTKESAYEQFSFLLDAFKYGVPPHGGIALGWDRLIMLLSGSSNIRDVIAFPKVQTSADLMTKAPGVVSEQQLEELGLIIDKEAADAPETETVDELL